jgi:hypothetical protein
VLAPTMIQVKRAKHNIMNNDDSQLEPVVQAFQTALFYNVLKLMIDQSFALGKTETLKSLETICQTFMSSLNDAEKKAFRDELNETIAQKIRKSP